MFNNGSKNMTPITNQSHKRYYDELFAGNLCNPNSKIFAEILKARSQGRVDLHRDGFSTREVVHNGRFQFWSNRGMVHIGRFNVGNGNQMATKWLEVAKLNPKLNHIAVEPGFDARSTRFGVKYNRRNHFEEDVMYGIGCLIDLYDWWVV